MTYSVLKHWLVAAAVAAVAADAFPFAWQPSVQNPNPSLDVTSEYGVENLSFVCSGVEGPVITDVMPIWVDEDGNEIPARSGRQNPNGWSSEEFAYTFSIEDFKSNGEYTLLFPEGMLLDAAGERSDKVELAFTFDVPSLNPPMFDDFEIRSISPDFSEAQAIWDNQLISINTNHNNAIGLATLQVFDLTEGESIIYSSNFSTGRNIGFSSAIEWNVAGVYKFIEGHDYRADFVFFNGKDSNGAFGDPTPVVDRVSYRFSGKIPAFEYSPVTLLGVAPLPGEVMISSPQQAVFTYTFSAPVTLYRAVTPLGSEGKNVYPSSCITSNDDKTVWTLDLSDDKFMLSQGSSVIINAYVRDADGYQLHGNQGSEDNSCFQYEWDCELGAEPMVIVSPASGSSLGRLSEIVVKAASGKSISWSWMGSASIRSQERGELGRIVFEGDAAAASEVRFSHWIPVGASASRPIDISEEGNYTVFFDHGCFFSGEESQSKQSKSVSSSFRISSGGDDTPSFADFRIISISPDLSAGQGIWTDQRVEVATNYNDAIGYATLEIRDEASGRMVVYSDNYASGRAPGDSSNISWVVSGTYKFMKGNAYTADFVFYNAAGESTGVSSGVPEVGRASFRFSGTVEDEVYSSLSLLGVEPKPGSVVISSPREALMRYSFSGPVDVYKAVSPVAGADDVEFPSSCLSSSEEGTVWTLDLSQSEYVRGLDATLVVSIYVRDLEGKPLKGNYGQNEDSRFRYEWDCVLGAHPVEVVLPEAGSEIESLTEVTVKSVDGTPIAWAEGYAAVRDASGRVIGRLCYDSEADVEATDRIRFSSWIPSGESAPRELLIEEKGEYSVSFAAGCFRLGETASAKLSREASSSFSVAGRTYSTLSLLGVEPLPMATVLSSPEQAVFVYSFSGPVSIARVVTPLADGSVVEYPASCLSSSEDGAIWTLDLSADTYVSGLEGILTLCLYARDLDGYPLEGNSGEGEESCFLYEWESTIGALPELSPTFAYVALDPEAGSVITSLSSVRLTFPQAAFPLVSSVEVCQEGVDVPVAYASVNVDSEDSSVIVVALEEPLMLEGVYSIAFPEGAVGDEVCFDSESATGLCSPSFTLSYTVEPEDDGVDIISVAYGCDVFDIHGRLLLHKADADALRKLPKGIYVMNGKKIVIKQ